jgi:hypothetical protein
VNQRATASDHDGVILGTDDRATTSHHGGVSVGKRSERQGGEKQNETHSSPPVTWEQIHSRQDAKRVKESGPPHLYAKLFAFCCF